MEGPPAFTSKMVDYSWSIYFKLGIQCDMDEESSKITKVIILSKIMEI